jgi:outer membrane lipoprotein carrier protein
MRRALLALCAATLPGTGIADGSADERAAERLEAALRGVSALRAEFRQSVTNAEGQPVESSEGVVSLARPGRFRWDYRTPEQVIVSDGTTVWFYDAELAQVTIRPAADTLAGTPALLLSGTGDLRAEFAMADAGEEAGLAWTQLTPKRSDGDFRALRVGVGGGELRSMTLVDRLGHTSRLEFTNIERNPHIDPAIFSFTPPPGVDVVGRAPAGQP